MLSPYHLAQFLPTFVTDIIDKMLANTVMQLAEQLGYKAKSG